MYKKINTEGFPPRYVYINDKIVETLNLFDDKESTYFNYSITKTSRINQDDNFVYSFYLGTTNNVEDIKKEEYDAIKNQILKFINS